MARKWTEAERKRQSESLKRAWAEGKMGQRAKGKKNIRSGSPRKRLGTEGRKFTDEQRERMSKKLKEAHRKGRITRGRRR